MTWRPVAIARQALSPERLLALSFAGLIALGTIGFMVIPGLYSGPSLTWLDALFTATSAVCVTGLIVVDTATYFTTRGQGYVLLLVQLGGLGILTLTTAVIMVLGRRLSLNHEAVSATAASVMPDLDFRRLVLGVLRFTLTFEVVGAAVLFLVWLPRFGPVEAAWHATFQAVSAFCNAGFSTFTDSLTGFRTSALALGPMMALIVLGGVGFVVLEDVRLWKKRRREGVAARLTLHSRLALAATALLLVGGTAGYAVLEWRNALAGLSPTDRVMNALFMSVTARTAGFNTVDYAMVGDGASFLTILLMSVGGSPGSTAGGLKTTTVAVLGLLAVARLRGRTVASVWDRTIPADTVDRAIGLFVVGFTAVTAAILVYTVTGPDPVRGAPTRSFLRQMFEAVSAFNTVGLSMGTTGSLDGLGKALTILLMYVGRIGPLTLAVAMSANGTGGGGEFRYAHEDVIIG